MVDGKSSLDDIISANAFVFPSLIPDPVLNSGCFPLPFPCDPPPVPCELPNPNLDEGLVRIGMPSSSSSLLSPTSIGAAALLCFRMCSGASLRGSTSSSEDRTSTYVGAERVRVDEEVLAAAEGTDLEAALREAREGLRSRESDSRREEGGRL